MKEISGFKGTLVLTKSASYRKQKDAGQNHAYEYLEFEGINGNNIRVENVRVHETLYPYIKLDGNEKYYVVCKSMGQKIIVAIRNGNKEHTLLNKIPQNPGFFNRMLLNTVLSNSMKDLKTILERHNFNTEPRHDDVVI